jgi:hypothetical protein
LKYGIYKEMFYVFKLAVVESCTVREFLEYLVASDHYAAIMKENCISLQKLRKHVYIM